jgi:sugar-specific transcriptional regulator TrmB
MIKPKILEKFGLNEKEARVYLAALELGGAGVQEIAVMAGIHRVSTYDLLENLKEKGFVFEAQQGKRRLIMPMEPEQVAAAIRSKEKLFSALVPELTAIRGKTEGKPQAQYFENHDGVWKALQDLLTMSATDSEILIYGSAQHLLSEYPIELSREEGATILTNANLKNLLEKINTPDQIMLPATGHFGSIKHLPDDKKINGNIFIYDDKVLTVSWKDLTAVIITDKYNADNQRCIFNLLWELLP